MRGPAARVAFTAGAVAQRNSCQRGSLAPSHRVEPSGTAGVESGARAHSGESLNAPAASLPTARAAAGPVLGLPGCSELRSGSAGVDAQLRVGRAEAEDGRDQRDRAEVAPQPTVALTASTITADRPRCAATDRCFRCRASGRVRPQRLVAARPRLDRAGRQAGHRIVHGPVHRAGQPATEARGNQAVVDRALQI